MAMKQKIMHVIGEDELLDFHAAFAETSDQIDGLGEIHVAVVVAMNEKHR